MSVCQYVIQLGYQNKSCSKCHKDVRQSLCHYVSMSACQYVNMSIGLYVSMSVCQYVRMQLFSLGIKMKVVHNVIGMSDSQKILVRKSLRTAKEPPALVEKVFFFILVGTGLT